MKTARAVPVLMYHHVSPAAGAVTVSPAHFADQMAMLARKGYTMLGAGAVSAHLAGVPVPDKSVVLTFDDGYPDNRPHAHPGTAQHGFTAIGFRVSGWINDGPVRLNLASTTPDVPDVPELLRHTASKEAIEAGETDKAIARWSEIRAMLNAGTFEFHSLTHTHMHTRWDRMSADPWPDAPAFGTICSNPGQCSNRTSAASDHRCSPQGYFDTGYREEAAAAGFRHLHTVQPGTNLPRGDPGNIFRLDVRDQPAAWPKSRLWIHSRPLLSRLYLKIK